jgi:hypothetical protein
MFEPQANCRASFTQTFLGDEDEIVDTILSILRRDGWENLKMHYESGSLSAEKTDLRTRSTDDGKSEEPLTFALSASWFSSEDAVELMVEVTETEQEWSQDECASIVESILIGLKNRFPLAANIESAQNN